MDAKEVRRRIDAIIERQDIAIEKLTIASAAFEKAIDGLRIGLDAIRGANDAQHEALLSLRAGNQEAWAILRGLPQ